MLAFARERLKAPEAPADAIFVVLTARASTTALERFLPNGETHESAFFWAPGTLARAYDEWTVAGSGAVLQIDESGEDRWSRVQAAAARSFSAITEWAETGVVAPRLRLFGGASFHPSVRDPLWAPFGDASFVLPRWLYGVKKDDAFLRFAFRRDELAQPQTLLSEIARMEIGEDFRPISDGVGSRSNAPVAGEVDPQWRKLVQDALAAIHEKTFEKVVVARRAAVSQSISVPVSVQHLLRQNPESTTFACVRSGSAFLGASPERLIFVEGERVITEALAGTIARGEDDEAAKRALFTSDKDRREHQIVVDGITAAIGPFSSGIDVSSIPAVRTLGRVHHLATPIVGRLDHPTHVLSLVAALHPTPAVSGLPKRAAADWIRDHESFERGWYAAPVGWFDDRGDGTFAVAIRSALVEEDRAWVFAGAGIVEGSEPDAEFRETQLKQKTILAALGSTSGISP